MRFACIWIAFSSLTATSLTAQKSGVVTGVIMDTIAMKAISEVTVTVMRSKDSSLVSFSTTDASGRFRIGNLANGRYRMLVTHISYHHANHFFEITDSLREVKLDNITLHNKSVVLDEVIVNAEAPPVALVGDTVQYNAGSFKTPPNSSVEQLLKKLPGIDVAKDGTVTAQGRKVLRVLVDSREFFGNDPKVATRNLTADMIDKVQVYEARSDQASLTGFNDGRNTMTINLKLKADKKKGMFGKLNAGGGTNGRYEGKANVNQFKGARQLSLLASANNINASNFGELDVSGNGTGTIGSQPTGSMGIQETQSAGINYSNILGTKTELSGSYLHTRSTINNEIRTRRQYLLPDSTYYYNDVNNASNKTSGNRFLFKLLHMIDSFHFIKLLPSIEFQRDDNMLARSYMQFGEDWRIGSEGRNDTRNKSSRYRFNGDLFFGKKFPVKGRTFSMQLTSYVADSKSKGVFSSFNTHYEAGVPVITPHNAVQQQSVDNNNNGQYLAKATYTEPLFSRSLLEFQLTKKWLEETKELLTYDLNSNTGKYDIPNADQTSDFINRNHITTAGIRLYARRKKLMYSAGVAWQQSDLEGKIMAGLKDSVIGKLYRNVLPDIRIQYEPRRSVQYSFNYITQTQAPQLYQLQPVPDISQLPTIRLGNPGLQQEYLHMIMLNMMKAGGFSGKTFFANVAYHYTANRISVYDSMDNAGLRYTKPVNVNGVYAILANASVSFPMDLLYSRWRLGLRGRHGRDKQFINGMPNHVAVTSIMPTAAIDIEFGTKASCSVSGMWDLNFARYGVSPPGKVRYGVQTYEVEIDWELPAGFGFQSEFQYLVSKQAQQGAIRVPLWHATISKLLLKDHRGQFKLRITDLLNRNQGIVRTATQNYLDEQQIKNLRRFAVLSFTYNIGKASGK